MRGLLARKVPVTKIGRILESLRRQIGNRPLPRLAVYADGERVVVWDGESRWQPESGQFLFNFEAGQVLQRARKIAQLPAPQPRTKLPRLSADEWCDLGIELEDGSPLEARAAYHHALDLNPLHVTARINLGRLLHGEGKLEGAESHYREALRHEPGNALAWYNLGVLLEDRGRADQALPCYEHAVHADPGLADAHYNLALLYERSGRKQDAVRHLAIFRLLFQLPPYFRFDAARLADFLGTLPHGLEPTFEFRHESWFNDETYDLLGKHRAALCIAEADDFTTPPVPTAPFGYLRLRRADYGDDDLDRWATRVRDIVTWKRVYVYFKHEESGRGPALARAFLD